MLGSLATLSGSTVFAAEEQFNDALRAASAGDTVLLEQYQLSMQNDVLGYYPEYWKLNTNLVLQPPANIVAFAQRYPQSAHGRKAFCRLCRRKVKLGDYVSPQSVVPYVTNPDRAESCALAQVRAKAGDDLVLPNTKMSGSRQIPSQIYVTVWGV